MEEEKVILTDEDFREALKEFGSYVDITEEDLKKLYVIAVKIARERCIHAWLVREIMTFDVVSVTADTDIHEAGKLLINNKISGMPVVDDEKRVIGILSVSDLLTLAGIPTGHVFNDAVMKYVLRKPVSRHRTGKKVKDVMSTSVISVSPETPVKKVAMIMDKKGIKRIPVVEEDNRLAGIVSRGDILRIICEGDQPSTKTL